MAPGTLWKSWEEKLPRGHGRSEDWKVMIPNELGAVREAKVLLFLWLAGVEFWVSKIAPKQPADKETLNLLLLPQGLRSVWEEVKVKTPAGILKSGLR